MSLAAAAVLCLLPAGAQTPAGDAVSDFDYAVDVVERAYAGYPDKTAGREAKYAALKGRLQSEISGDRDVYDAIAEYLGWSPFLTRLLFVIISCASVAVPGILVYLVLWFVMPNAQSSSYR